MSITLPQKVKFQKIADNHEEAIIGPCYPGYGITLGNALKRVLLSSLEGGAAYAVKIKGVQHEFSTIPDVLEDVIEIILNLKKIRFKVHSDEGVKVTLEVKGKKEVKAKDIKTTSDVEIITPDIPIATLTSSKAEIKMDIFVKKGRGYWPIEEREDEKEIGVIAIDSFFSPIKKVGLDIENVRVKQMTNYENIILNIETDGTISPQEAVKEATGILIDQFKFIDSILEGEETKEKTQPKKKESKKSEKSQKEEKAEKKEEKPKSASKKQKK